MNSCVLDSLTTWARRACGKGMTHVKGDPPVDDAAATFRLRAWPELPDLLRTAPVYRLLSVMSVQPVSRGWMLEQSRLSGQDLDALLAHLQAGGELVSEAMPRRPLSTRTAAPVRFAI